MPLTQKTTIEKLLSEAGIIINGNQPWDIQVHNKKFYGRVLTQGSLGLGESYIDGWWNVKQLDEFFNKILRANLEKDVRYNWKILLQFFGQILFNPQRKLKAFEIGERHYDIGNDLYLAMLDKRLVYTCGYWKDAKSLDEAQEAKLDLICKKLMFRENMRVLDIGCGWGSFARYAAEKYGVSVVGVTVSKEQVELGNKLSKGLPVKIILQDYRYINDQYDRIVSLGMFEHVGYKNYRTFMKIAHSCLKDDGLFLLHTIGKNKSTKVSDPWFEKYIFPNSMLPSIKQIGASIEDLFVMEDWHNFGTDYDKTLMEWFKNFDTNWENLKQQYNERFYRMWKYYLLSSSGSFRARRNQLWQIVLSKKGVLGGYIPIR